MVFGNKETQHIKNREAREISDLVLKWKKRKVSAADQYAILLNTTGAFKMGLEMTAEGKKITTTIDDEFKKICAINLEFVEMLKKATSMQKAAPLNNPAYG